MPSKSKNINELIDDTFMDKNKFSMTIENIVKDSNRTLSYIDAIVDFCESKDIAQYERSDHPKKEPPRNFMIDAPYQRHQSKKIPTACL